MFLLRAACEWWEECGVEGWAGFQFCEVEIYEEQNPINLLGKHALQFQTM